MEYTKKNYMYTKKNKKIPKNKLISKKNKISNKTINKTQRKKLQKGGVEVTKEMKAELNEIMKNSAPNMNKLPSVMSKNEISTYEQILKDKEADEQSIRDPFVHEYMFSPLLSEQMKKEKDALAGSYLVGVNPLKFYDHVKKIIQGKRDKNALNNTLSSLGNWVDSNRDYDRIQIQNMGYRNDSGMVLKPEEILTNNSSFKEIVAESKKYSSISKKGKITARGLIKMARILSRFGKNDSTWLRVATALEVIYENLGLKISRENFFKSERIIPEYTLLEIEEFFNTNHLFMTMDELKEFKNKLKFYHVDKVKLVNKLESAKAIIR